MSEEAAPTDVRMSKAQIRKLYVIVGSVLIAMMLATLDNLVLGTAMATIVGELGGLDQLSWVVTAYALASAVSTPVWGKLGDMYGRKGMYLTSIVVFLIGSVLAGLSQTMGQLIAFRGVQGLGAGGLMVGALAIISTVVPPREQGRYQGLVAAAMGVTMAAGPLVGGLVTDSLGWRWCFYINVPLGLLALFMVSSVLKLPKHRSQARIDYPGVMLLALAISAVVLVSAWGGTEYSWSSGVILALIGTGAIATVCFVLVERVAQEPVLPLGLFRNANFSLVQVNGLLVGALMFGLMTFLPLFLQVAGGASASNAGLLLMPTFIAMMATNMTVGRLITATGRYKAVMVAGGALSAAGMLMLARLSTDTSSLYSGTAMVLVGCGTACMMQTAILVSIQSVEAKDLGVAASTATLSRTIGGSIGISVMGAVFATTIGDALNGLGGGTHVGEGKPQIDPAKLAELPASVQRVYQEAAADGTGSVFLLAAGLALVALVVSAVVKEVPLRETAAVDVDADDDADSDTGDKGVRTT
ncbi:MDR family MFS transporter [Streptomyces cyaneofuscatus]|uniref:MDR family MFS transporter n=1 Tax=Streptomyces cyaneofuscatus TaxID=66883 RepID=UPI00379241EA